MRFLFFSKGTKEVPSSRYRVYYLAEALETLGHAAEIYPVKIATFGDWRRLLRALLSAHDDDVIFLQRSVYSRAFIIAVMITYACGRRYVFDIDDSTIYEGSARRARLLARLAKLVTGGSEFVLSWARTQNARTSYLPNGLPLSVYRTAENAGSGAPVVGWIGDGPVHAKNLALLPAVFARLREHGTPFRFKLIGAVGDKRVYDLFKDTPEAEIIDTLDWADPANAVKEIQTFSVGVMPLDSESLNQAKYFKALEYMGCGVSVVATATDTLARIVGANGAGALVADESEWVLALERRLTDAALCEREGKRGREAVGRDYSHIAMARMLLNELGYAGWMPGSIPDRDLGIVVLNWNTSELLGGSLEAILKTVTRPTYELVAMDNHSSDGGFNMLPAALRDDARIRYVEKPENAGWKSVNSFFAATRGRYLVTVDADARVAEGCIDALYDFMESHPEAGAATANLVNPDGSPQRYFRRLYTASAFLWASVPGRIIDKFLLGSRHYRRARYEDARITEVTEIEQPSWPTLIVRREALRGRTFVNPVFPFYFVDVDLSRRIYEAGYKVYLVPEASAVHYKSTSYKRAAAKWRERDYDRSLALFFRMYYPGAALILVPLLYADRVLRRAALRLGVAL